MTAPGPPCGPSAVMTPGPSGPTLETQMHLKRSYDVTFDAVRQAVHNRPGWNDDCDADGRERWSGPCPVQAALGCCVSAGAEHLGDKQEVLMACRACNPDAPGQLGAKCFRAHLKALGCRVTG